MTHPLYFVVHYIFSTVQTIVFDNYNPTVSVTVICDSIRSKKVPGQRLMS